MSKTRLSSSDTHKHRCLCTTGIYALIYESIIIVYHKFHYEGERLRNYRKVLHTLGSPNASMREVRVSLRIRSRNSSPDSFSLSLIDANLKYSVRFTIQTMKSIHGLCKTTLDALELQGNLIFPISATFRQNCKKAIC